MGEKKVYSPEIHAILAKLCLMDDEFMTKVFDGNFEATELVLHIILEKDDLKVKKIQVQKEEKSPITGGRNVRLDIVAEDAEGKLYDIEVQRSNDGADRHRARFYSAVLDSRMLKKGDSFSQLTDSYVIFITENDVLGKGAAVYEIERVIKGYHEPFSDGSHIIYVNGSYRDTTTAIGRLMHDFHCTTAGDVYYDALKQPIQHFKETEGGHSSMCQLIEEYAKKQAKEAAAAAAAAAALQAKKEMVITLHRNNVSTELIAASAKETVETVQSWIDGQSA